jgi:hypothetical protein
MKMLSEIIMSHVAVKTKVEMSMIRNPLQMIDQNQDARFEE